MGRTAASLLHVDLDAFYASVEVLRRPGLRGRPVAVGGGVVLSATYEARRFGVHSGMRIAEARALCPGLRVVGSSFADYVGYSRTVMEVFRRFTPRVEPLSIDEAFLDVAGSMHLFGGPAAIGSAIRTEVRAETGLPASVGAATTKFLAKVASRAAKPDGMVVVEPGSEITFLHPRSVGDLWGVGPVTRRRLEAYGIRTVGQLAAVPPHALCGWLGRGTGRHLHALAWNRDPRPVEGGHPAGSVGAQSAFAGRSSGPDDHRRVLLRLAERVGHRLRTKGRAGRRITLRLRFADFTSITRQESLPGPIASTSAIYRSACRLMEEGRLEARGRALTLLGISVSGLVRRPELQMELPLEGPGDPVLRPGSPAGLAHLALDTAADAARSRYGRDAVSRAALLGSRAPDVPTRDHLPEPEDL